MMAERGFSLLEVVLAVAILGVVMSLMFSGFFAQSRVEKAAQASIDLSQWARVALMQMDRDVRRMVRPDMVKAGNLGLSGEARRVADRPGHVMILHVPAERPEPVVKVTYQTEAAGGDDGPMVITRLAAPLLRVAGAPAEPAETICRRVAGLEVFYVDEKGQERPDWTDAQKLPRAVRLRLTLAEAKDKTTSFDYLTAPLAARVWKGQR